MERKGAVLSKNIAISFRTELDQENQRVAKGLIPFVRKVLIEKTYKNIPKGKSL